MSVVSLTRKIEKSYVGQYVSQQLVRSAISPALNYGEARSAESLKDFIHKLKISVKELRETHVSLRIIRDFNLVENSTEIKEITECNELISILVATIKTCQLKLVKS